MIENNDADCSSWQFPSYSLRLELAKKAENEIEKIQTLCLDISLLTEAHTIFLEDRIKIKGLIRDVRKGNSSIFYVLSTQMAGNKIFDEYVALLKEIIPDYFPRHKFFDHFSLFNLEISSCIPYHENHMPGSQYSIYDFLFSSAYSNLGQRSIQVLK